MCRGMENFQDEGRREGKGMLSVEEEEEEEGAQSGRASGQLDSTAPLAQGGGSAASARRRPTQTHHVRPLPRGFTVRASGAWRSPARCGSSFSFSGRSWLQLPLQTLAVLCYCVTSGFARIPGHAQVPGPEVHRKNVAD